MFALPGYEPLAVIHRGPRRAVVRGRRQADGLPVVVKLLVDAHPSPGELSQLRHEFTMTRRAEAEGVVRALDLCPERNGLALVLEDAGAHTLDRWAAGRRLDARAFLDVAIPLAQAVGRIHDRGTIHNNLQPAKVVLDAQGGQMRVVGFGRASALSREDQPVMGAHRLEGALAYISPEQTGRMNRAVDWRSDLYSLGVTLYQLLTGRLPFDSEDPMELVHCHLARTPEPADRVAPGVPPMLARIVARLLAKAAEDRYASAAGLLADLERCRQDLARGGIAEFEPGQHDALERFVIPQQLYGREPQVEQLMNAFARAAQGSAEMVLVTGRAGIGKTSLVAEIHKPVTASRGAFVAGKFDQLQRGVPFSALLGALGELVRLHLGASDAALAAWREQLLQALGPNGRVITDTIPEFQLVLGAQPAVPLLAPGSAQVRFHRVLQDLIRCCASPEQPLVLFLDDLQWADAATLDLLGVLLGDRDTRGLLVVGAYREAEVDAAHPLRLALERLHAAGRAVQDIALPALDLPSCTRLVHDAVGGRADAADIERLAQVALDKTAGNPFFLHEFLKSLSRDGLLAYDRARGRWQWDADALAALRMADNVVDLMTERLARLPQATREVLQTAACIGAEFELGLLAHTLKLSAGQALDALWPALETGLVTPLGRNYQLVRAAEGQHIDEKVSLRFLHDRVQQAAYASQGEAARAQAHLRIGRWLREGRDDAAQAEHCFEIVDHLNRAADLATPDERLALARLNLLAVRRAKAASAFRPALAYAEAGLAVLAEDWARQPTLCCELHVEATEVAQLAADYPAMERHAQVVMSHVKDPLQVVPVHEARIRAAMATNRMRESVEIALDVLPSLGVRMPRRQFLLHTLLSLATVRWRIGRRDTEALLALPAMTDSRVKAAMALLTTAAQPAYYAAPDILPVLLLKIVDLSLQHGNSPLSAFAWTSYGHMQNIVFNKPREALRYGNLGRDVLARFDAPGSRAKVAFIFHAFIHLWNAPWRDTLQPLEGAYRTAVDTGDLEYAATSAIVYCWHLLSVSDDLDQVLEAMRKYETVIVRAGQARSQRIAGLSRQIVRNLAGSDPLTPADEPWRLVGSDFDETQALPLLQASQDRTGLTQLSLYQAQMAYLFGRPEALAHIQAAALGLEAVIGMIFSAQVRFYEALIHAAAGGARHLKQARRARAVLARWSQVAPANHAHRVALVDAEIAAAQRQYDEATRCYDRAIEGARAEALAMDEALSLERAARFHLQHGSARIGQVYLADARHRWQRYGASAKVRALEREFPALAVAAAAVAGPTGPQDRVDALDVATVTKAAAAISREIRLAPLLERMLRIALENAGAERGALLFETDGELRIEALGTATGPITVMQSLPYESSDGADALPASIVHYVARTREPVVLGDAVAQGRFTQDRYVVARRSRSVLCAPLVAQGKLSAIVLLENEAAPHVFTAQRVELLRILSSQAAIAIDNARLYDNLQAALGRQVQLSQAQARFVPREFLQALDRNSIVDVSLGENVRKEMSILFSDIRGFTPLVEGLSPQEHIGFINRYLSHMEPPIIDAGGFVDSYIGDAIMALFDGAPDQAVRAAIGMGERLHVFNAERAREGQPPVRIGVGINTGPLTLGTIGGPMRIKCGVIGDSVNLAARVEGLTKTYGASLLISHHTRDRLRRPDDLQLRLLDRVTVLGQSVPTTLYEVLDAEPPALRDAKAAQLGAWNEAWALYQSARFDDAAQLYAACAQACPQDVAAAHFVQRCQRLALMGVPADWTGVELLDHK